MIIRKYTKAKRNIFGSAELPEKYLKIRRQVYERTLGCAGYARTDFLASGWKFYRL